MSGPLRFLIVDGYPVKRREELESRGITPGWKLHTDMLMTYLPDAEWDVVFPCDANANVSTDQELAAYAGMIWTGSSLSITDRENPYVTGQIDLAGQMFETGVPGWGSCWGMQVAAVAAGGEAEKNPRGKEIGIARKIIQTRDAHDHPMFEGKSRAFDCFSIHNDMVTQLPEGGVLLAGNEFTQVQALAITHKNGTFWGTQYHLEFTLHEMARLILSYEKALIQLNYFKDHSDLKSHVDRMESLFRAPDRKDLRWQLSVGSDLLSGKTRQREFSNWITRLVLPEASRS